MTTTDDVDTDMDLNTDDLNPATAHRDLLQREVDRLTDELDNAIAAKASNATLIKQLRAQRVPLERAIRAMTPRSERQ